MREREREIEIKSRFRSLEAEGERERERTAGGQSGIISVYESVRFEKGARALTSSHGHGVGIVERRLLAGL